MFSFFRRKPENHFSKQEKKLITDAIEQAERCTSGEIRVFVENRCRFVDPLDRAAEIFQGLKMHETAARNGVLVYIAMKDRQLAIFGDEGIHRKVGYAFWNEEVKKMLQQFNKDHYAAGIAQIVQDTGAALAHHFPYDRPTDTNELPDDIVFGK